MADKKISALTNSTTPLAGSEVLPIVQSGSTVKVSVDNLTTGKEVPVGGLSSSGNIRLNTTNAAWNTTAKAIDVWGFGAFSGSADLLSTDVSSNYYLNSSNLDKYKVDYFASLYRQTNGTHTFYVAPSGTANNTISWTTALSLSNAGNATVNAGNLVVGTAGKGIDFSANTHAAGMTSELLNWYEEGTWTPTQGAGLTVVGAFSSYGYYTRIGRHVTVFGSISGATSVAAASGAIMCGALPFAVVVPGVGTANSNTSVTAAASEIYSNANIGATSTIIFSCTYFV